MELKFENRIWTTGNANVVTIPKAFIKHGLLDFGKEYEIVIREKTADPQEAASNGLYGTLTLDLLTPAELPEAQQTQNAAAARGDNAACAEA